MSGKTGGWGYYSEAGTNARVERNNLASYETIIKNARTMSAAEFRTYLAEARKILRDNDSVSGNGVSHDAYIIRAFDELEKEDKESSERSGTSDFHKNVALLADYVHKMDLPNHPTMVNRAMSDKYKSGLVKVGKKLQTEMIMKQMASKENS